MAESIIRIGTRGSDLALTQSRWVMQQLLHLHPHLSDNDIELVVIKTTGDQVQGRPLAEIGGKGLFTKEIEEALLDKRVDLAVHSMKDMPTTLPDGLTLGCVPAREDPRDAFISRDNASFMALPEGGTIGTTSLRRSSILAHRRPDLRFESMRGNVPTRLEKLRKGDVDAIILAMAGLNRLGMSHVVTEAFEPEVLLSAVGQGALAIETREDDAHIADILAPLHDVVTSSCCNAERSMLHAMGGDCHTPIAAYASIDGDTLTLTGAITKDNGKMYLSRTASGKVEDAEALGKSLGKELFELHENS